MNLSFKRTVHDNCGNETVPLSKMKQCTLKTGVPVEEGDFKVAAESFPS